MGGMGSEDTNFHAEVYRRMGYADVVDEVTSLFRSNRKDEAAAIIPDAVVDDAAIVGDVDYVRGKIREWEAAGVTTMLVTAKSVAEISELADISVAEPLKAVRSGEVVQAKILRIDAKRQRIGLSRRQSEQAEDVAADEPADVVGEAAASAGVAPADAVQPEGDSDSYSSTEPEALLADVPEAASEPMTGVSESAAATMPEALADSAAADVAEGVAEGVADGVADATPEVDATPESEA